MDADAEMPMIDWESFSRTRAELGAAFVRILGYFREDGETAVERIEQATHARDAAGLVLSAHRLKSEARQFGAEVLGTLAEEIEFAGRRGVEMRFFPDEIVPAVARLRSVYRETETLLEREANPLCRRARPA